ncbi:MAG: MazG family protein, partial [Candidatus Nanopelagicales bacterium]
PWPQPLPRMPGRLVLLATSHRVASGLLTHSAWTALREADQVVGLEDHPLLGHLAEAGIPCEVVGVTRADERARWLLQESTTKAVVWLVGDDGDSSLTEALAPLIAQRAEDGTAPELEVVHGSFDVPGARLIDVVAVMDRLRSPGGCPWDAEQTHASLAPYLLEETYETLEALDSGDIDHVREELGDLLLQVVFHARIAEENTDRPWSIDDVAAGIVEKLVSRHPHVFADGDATTAAEVEQNWEAIKAAEKGRTSAVDGVPLSLPALALASKLIGRVTAAGIDVEIEEPELPDNLTEEQLGLILFGLVSAARRQGLDPESALRRHAHTFSTIQRERRVLPG